MPKTLNYKFALFPTTPQRRHLGRQMRECRIQYNRAVKTRKRLKGSLLCYKVEPVLREVLSIQKDNNQSLRANAISRLQESYPDISPRDLPTIYDIRNIFGRAFPITAKHLDLGKLASEIQPLLQEELREFKNFWRLPEDGRPSSPPRRPLYFCLLRATSNYAGFEAKHFMDKAFYPKRTVSRATVRFNVSGNKNSRFEKACDPSPAQRRIGNPGEPRRRRRVEAFGYQETREVFVGNQLTVRCLPQGMDKMRILRHRPIPQDARLKQMTIMQDGRQWYAVMTMDVSDAAYRLEAKHPDRSIGLDPGAETAITAAVINEKEEVAFEKIDWRPLEGNLEKLERISQQLSQMQGPDRRKQQRASKRWLKLNRQRSNLHRRIKNQRSDVLHKLSRHLANHGFIAIGHWEPPRQVSGRAEFQQGRSESVEPGPKGIVAARRGGRDRSIATLRRLTEEKADRSGVQVITHAEEYNTTRRCSACDELTGPKGDRSIRKWSCDHCGSEHDRDGNAALNILKLALNLQEKE